jgi:hypothetical protein
LDAFWGQYLGVFFKRNGPPGRIRTCNLRLRRPLHYPVVLRAEQAEYPILWVLGPSDAEIQGTASGYRCAHHTRQHRTDTLIQQCLRFDRAIEQIN